MTDMKRETHRLPAQRITATACNHRGHAREFSRDEQKRVMMVCTACGHRVITPQKCERAA